MVEDHLTSKIDGNGSPPIKNLIYGVLTKLLYLIKSAIQIMHGCESQKSNYALGYNHPCTRPKIPHINIW